MGSPGRFRPGVPLEPDDDLRNERLRRPLWHEPRPVDWSLRSGFRPLPCLDGSWSSQGGQEVVCRRDRGGCDPRSLAQRDRCCGGHELGVVVQPSEAGPQVATKRITKGVLASFTTRRRSDSLSCSVVPVLRPPLQHLHDRSMLALPPIGRDTGPVEKLDCPCSKRLFPSLRVSTAPGRSAPALYSRGFTQMPTIGVGA